MEIISHSVTETLKIGRAIARQLALGSIVCLCGDLGSGKTVLTKGISTGLGVDPHAVISPTFVLMRQYEGSVPVYHFDLYRIEQASDILGIGYEEYLFDDGVSVIEWADRFGCLLPKEFLKVSLFVRDRASRRLVLSGKGARYKEIARKIYEDYRH